MSKPNYTTSIGGQIVIDGRRLQVLNVGGVDQKVIWLCPECGADSLTEVADFVQFGLLGDVHDLIWRCNACQNLFVAEFEVSL